MPYAGAASRGPQGPLFMYGRRATHKTKISGAPFHQGGSMSKRYCWVIGMAAALASGAALGAGTFNAGAAVGTMPLAKDTADGFFAKALTIPPVATSFAACAQKVNGQLRIADASGCHPSEIAVTLGAGGTTPVEVSRVLTIPPGSGGQF